MASVEALRAASLEKAISNLKQQSKKDGRFFDISEQSTTKTYADAIIEIMALNDSRRHQVSLQDRTLFMRSYHSDNTLAKRCKRIAQDRDRVVGGLTQQSQELRSQYSTFVRSKRMINQMSVDQIELGTAKYMKSAIPNFVPQSDIFYLSKRNKIQRRTMANPERVSSLLSRARTMIQKFDHENLNKNRLSKSAPQVESKSFKNQTYRDIDHEVDENENEKANDSPPKEEIDFSGSFYVTTGAVNNDEQAKVVDENLARKSSVSFEQAPVSNEKLNHSDINEKMRMFFRKINTIQTDEKGWENEISENLSMSSTNELPQITSTPKHRNSVPADKLELPPVENSKTTLNEDIKPSHGRVPITCLSRVRIVPPSMDILKEEKKREVAIKYPTCSSDRCAIRIAMCRDSQPIAEKLHTVTSTRDIMLIRSMLESKRDLLAKREQRLKKYRTLEKKKEKRKCDKI